MDGQDVIDLLRRFAESSDPDRELAGRLAAVKIAIHAVLLFSEFEHRLLAACALARLEASTAVLPVLAEGLRSSEAHQVYAAYACRSLGSLAAPLVPTLIEVLHNQEHETAAYHAIQAIEHIGPPAIAAVPDLIKILREARPGNHGVEVLHGLGAAAAIGEIRDRAALPALKECLSLEADGDDLVEMLKEEAAEALAKINKIPS